MNFEEMTKDELIQYINNLNEEQNGKYGLVWDREKVPEQIVIECDKYIPVLREDKEKTINNGEIENILIEGDNFHSLSVLNYTHKESIDAIYIDPPYNTGHKDFIYNDKYVDETDGYKHSKWLNFMSKRLKIARELLKDTGVIFISISYHEYAQLKLLCDKIFDESNYLETIVQNKGNAQNDATDIQHNHEYILVYRKKARTYTKNGKTKILPTIINKKLTKKNVEKDSKGFYYKSGSFTTGSAPTLNERNNMGWTIYFNPKTNDKIAKMDYDILLAKTENDESKIYTNDEKLLSMGYEIIRAPKKGSKLGRWSWGIEKFNACKDDVLITKKEGKFSINVKKYVDPEKVTEENGKYYFSDIEESNSKSVIDFSSAYGTTSLNNVVKTDSKFNNPKNPEMIKYLISLVPKDDAIILDFFAGSGTTAQAVLELNDKDKGKRKFILCTNNENNICNDFTYPRIKNTIKNLNNCCSLQYFKTDFVDYSGTKDQLYYDLTEKCIPMLCVKGNTFDKIELNNEYEIYANSNKSKYSCVYFDIFGLKFEEFINKISSIKENKLLYIFTLGDFINTEDLKSVYNYTIEPIPYKIVELYKKIVKMSKEN